MLGLLEVKLPVQFCLEANFHSLGNIFIRSCGEHMFMACFYFTMLPYCFPKCTLCIPDRDLIILLFFYFLRSCQYLLL